MPWPKLCWYLRNEGSDDLLEAARDAAVRQCELRPRTQKRTGSHMDYVATKNFVANLVSSANADVLAHVHGGMAALLLARVITRRSLATPIPLACVIGVQFLNECIDRYNHGSWRWPDTLADTFNTLLWPTVLFVGLRLRRHREA